ncbi:anaphase-promoting complex subunit 2 [Phlebotomus argentipes]|uniref:anaphase-promoting complex subunit 2 n=1 Tax=Phlebotomus argentipes TaxID=94469 RepID=UPI002892AB1D|nr:anaphase-promoting complex subunit 2 [Phlebotomus argentipes]
MDKLWEKTVENFPILDRKLMIAESSEDDLKTVVDELIRMDIAENVYETVFIEIATELRQKVAPKFWLNFRQHSDQDDGFCRFQKAVSDLREDFRLFSSIVDRLKVMRSWCDFRKIENRADEAERFSEIFRTTLLSQLPVNFNDIVVAFYKLSFRVFANSHMHEVSDPDDLPEMDEMKCSGCQYEADSCRCQELINAFNSTNRHLIEMGLLDRLAGFTLTNLIEERIETSVREMCKGVFASNIDTLEKWLSAIVINWLIRIYNLGCLKIDEENAKMKATIAEFHMKLNFFMYETYANVIIEQFFDIIIDFPESQPAIDDLKVCFEKVDLRPHLVQTLKVALETRLLHPGVDTADILTGYVSAIKAIRHLDSSGVLLETMTEPVREYLRSRCDTVRCVVTGLIEDGPTDLAEELAKSEALKEEGVAVVDDLANWEAWMPDPVDANPAKLKPNRSADIISMVVDIYGSKEVFVNEYKNLLAERLLLQLDLNSDKEIRNLELLKLRFGESVLHSCEVMLKDISDSKRINARIQGDTNYSDAKMFEFSSLILSAQFWPVFKKEDLELPEAIQGQFESYRKSYETFKGNRTLVWRPVSGKVTMDVEIMGKVTEFTVTPTQATIIWHFQEKTEWNLTDLGNVMKIPPSVLRRKITYWQSHGLIKETRSGSFVLVEETTDSDLEEMQTEPQDICDEDEEAENVVASASDQREEELQVFWSYIVGMLTNLDSLPIERIHQMLKMFASNEKGVEFSLEELKRFLQTKVREHQLIFASGVYLLPK